LFATSFVAARAEAQSVNCAGVAPWNATTTYMIGDKVTFQNTLYQSLITAANVQPDACPSCGWWTTLGACGAADSTAPSMPSGLVATTTTSTTVALKWNAATDNAGGSGIAGYDVLRGGASIATTAGTSFTVTGLAPNTAFSFSVRARDNAGNVSAASPAIAVTTSPAANCTTLPTAPTGLAASGVTSTSVNLAWNASTAGPSCTVRYTVFQNGAQVASVASASASVGGLAPGTSSTFTVEAVDEAGSSVPSAGVSVTTPANVPPPSGADQLRFRYTTTTDSGATFTGHLLIDNPNATYVWNGSFFAVRNVQFQMTSTITAINSVNGAISSSASGGIVSLDLGFQSLFAMAAAPVDITFTASKAGTTVFPTNFAATYVRGADIVYPQYAGLPASWAKNKANLTAADLIASTTSYYQTTVAPSSAKLIAYTPQHPTQLLLGQVFSMPTAVNAVNNLRIWIPTRFMALGIGVAYEFFKLNPNYMVGLGTKENFAAGFANANAGTTTNPTVIDGVTWFWPIVLGHPDGPYQQETGNFNDTLSVFPDWLPPAASHGDYTTVQTRDDPTWITAGISSAISITVTREALNAVPVNYTQFMQQAKDPYAEFSSVDFAYNRGINAFYAAKIFTTNRAAALASTDIAADFNLAGFGSHVQTVRAVMDATNASSDLYDGQLTWADMQTFFAKLRMFYARGVPGDADWNAMIADVQRAFNVLAAHWANGTVSVRYDFLTLLRVAEQYLPQPRQPRPTGSDWYFQIKNAMP
jgi:chitodextrinase